MFNRNSSSSKDSIVYLHLNVNNDFRMFIRTHLSHNGAMDDVSRWMASQRWARCHSNYHCNRRTDECYLATKKIPEDRWVVQNLLEAEEKLSHLKRINMSTWGGGG